MGVVDKTVDTAGGTVVGAAKGAATGFLLPIVVGAAIAGGLALMAPIGLGWVAVAAATGGVVGGVVGSGPTATLGGAIGAIVGGAKRLFGGEKSPEPKIDQLLAAERERSRALTAAMIEQRQAAASSFDNPVKGDMAPKVQAQQQAAQQQGAGVSA